MISDRMTSDINALIAKETDWAVEHFGDFNSRHEAYAVALEEWEETEDGVKGMELYFKMLWLMIKADERDISEPLQELAKSTRQAIAELVQFAAMVDKLERYENREEIKNQRLSFLHKKFNITFPTREREKKTCEKCKHYTDAPEDLGHCDKCVITLDGTVTEFTPKEAEE